MKRLALTTIILSAVLATLPAHAVEHREGGRHDGDRFHESGRFHDEGHWHGGIERFHERDFHVWRQGHWEHRYHDGRYGWWWLAAGSWYFYPAPIYPYPDPYQPPVAVVPLIASAAPPAPQYWYYCDSAGGYYPYIPVCASGWRAVPAAPAR